MVVTPERFRRIAAVFEEASRRSGAERTCLLDEACGDDAALRAEVEALLRKDERARVALDKPPFGAALQEVWSGSESPQPPERVGNYRILEVLGEGGFGVVYRAEQERPRREVALKLLRCGSGSARALRRFEYEAQALARLQHPGVARILEAGTATVGGFTQAFLAMELVAGRPLLEHGRAPDGQARPLSVPQRLQLIVKICEALQHAHQNGVIHRDLKPENILVTADGQPRILDFGVARVLDAEERTTAGRTRSGQLVGTLAYMSPEQVLGDPSAVDTRCDIYAVGVLMYQLLSGSLPFAVTGSSLAAAIQTIREDEPRPLSSYNRALRGDIEVIVSKALAKDKTRRYQTAGELARDIERHLRGEPIEARRDSTVYVLTTMLRRHRWATATAGLFVAGVIAFAVYAQLQSDANRRLAQRERDVRAVAQESERVASAAQVEAARERDDARIARDAAERETARAEATTQFLVKMLGLANPDVTQSPEMTTLQMLDRAAPQVAQTFADQPESEARVRTNLGRAYAALGEPEKAKEQLERAYTLRRDVPGVTPAELYQIAWPLYNVLTDLSDVQAHERLGTCENLNREVILAREPRLAEALKATNAALQPNAVSEESRLQLGEFLTQAKTLLPVDDPIWIDIADYLFIRGYRVGYREHPDVAGDYLQAALNLERRLYPPSHSSILRTLSTMASYEVLAGEPVAAEAHVHDILNLLQGVLSDTHWYVAVQRARLGDCLIGQRRYTEAEQILKECYPRLLAQRGRGNGYVSTVLASLVRLYDAWGHAEDAGRYRLLMAENLASNVWYPDLYADLHFAPSLRQALCPEYTELFDALDRFNRAFQRRRNEKAALAAVLEVQRRLLPDEHVYSTLVADMLDKLTVRYVTGGGRRAIARQVFEATYRLDRCATVRHPRKSATTHWWLARLCEIDGDFVRGESIAFDGLRLLQEVDTSLYGFMGTMRSLAGGCLLGQGRFAEAEPIVVQAVEELISEPWASIEDRRIVLERVVRLYQETERPELGARYAIMVLQQLMKSATSANDLSRGCWPVILLPGLAKEHYQLALKATERAAAESPKSRVILQALAGARLRCGLAAEASAALDASERLGKLDLEGNIWRALVSAKLGDRRSAAEALETIGEAKLDSFLLERRPQLDLLLSEARQAVERM